MSTFRKILVAVDGSDSSLAALDAAIGLAAALSADLTIVHVLMHGRPADEFARMARVEHVIRETVPRAIPDAGELPSSMASYLDIPPADRARAVVEIGDYILRTAKMAAQEAGIDAVHTLSRDGDYSDAILDAADEIGADLIVVGSRGLGRLRGAILGSVSAKIARNAKCSVVTVR